MFHSNVALAPTRIRHRTTCSFSNKTWSHEDDHELIALVSTSSPPINWSQIAAYFPNKSETQVAERWNTVLDPSLLKGSWTRTEDETIIKFVAQNGTKSWVKLSALLPGRIGKQCRERWFNALDPAVTRGPWTPLEDRLLVQLHQRFGNRWTKISGLMPARSQNAIKNRWHSSLARRGDGTPAPTPIIQPKRTLLPSIALLPMPPMAPAIVELHAMMRLDLPPSGGELANVLVNLNVHQSRASK
jgi:hypothetical protein